MSELQKTPKAISSPCSAASEISPENTLGDFYIRTKLGSGSMGTVYLARQISRNRLAALKVLAREHASKADYVERFYREAALLHRLNHPNIVRCYRAGREKGLCYLGMEYIDGVNLRAAMGKSHPLPLKNALHVLWVCAEAMAHAHACSVIHRDLKPSNIMITASGRIKIADLGIARAADVISSVTRSGICMGTPEYMPPEQARDSRKADQRSDIYALGTIFYELLTGTLPFQGPSVVDMLAAKEQTFFIPASRCNPEVPQEVDLIIQKCLRPEPSRRYASCDDLLNDLSRLTLTRAPLRISSFEEAFSDLRRTRMTPTDQPPILIVHAVVDDIDFARSALRKLGKDGKIEVATDGNEALMRLFRQGLYSDQPRPSTLVLSVPFPPAGGRDLMTQLQSSTQLHDLEIIIVASTQAAKMVMRAEGFATCTRINHVEELKAFETLLPA